MPSAQVWPPAQTMSQAPQWRVSVASVAHTIPQATWAAGHESWQAPVTQRVPDGQAAPQVPQLEESTCGSTQRPAQRICPAGQAITQRPASQSWPVRQSVPQAPQLRRSLETSAQKRIPSATRHSRTIAPGASQVAAQRPATQPWPAAQAIPQAPQWAPSVSSWTQRSLHAVSPAGHAV